MAMGSFFKWQDIIRSVYRREVIELFRESGQAIEFGLADHHVREINVIDTALGHHPSFAQRLTDDASAVRVIVLVTC